MKKLLFFLLLIASRVWGQQRFENFTALRAQKGTYASWALVRYGNTSGDLMGGIFFWDSTSVVTDDAKRTIGTRTKGRYIKSEPLTQKRGTNSFNWSLGTYSYTFAHGLPTTPANVQYSFKGAVPLLTGSSWVADANNITIYVTALGTLGQQFTITWLATID